MSDVVIPVAPATGVWYDLDVTVAAVLAVLRLTASDVDAERIRALVPVAGQLIDTRLDRQVALTSPAPLPVLVALENLTVELYRRKDAPFGVLNAWSPDAFAIRIGRDQMAGIDSLLAGYRRRWGIG